MGVAADGAAPLRCPLACHRADVNPVSATTYASPSTHCTCIRTIFRGISYHLKALHLGGYLTVLQQGPNRVRTGGFSSFSSFLPSLPSFSSFLLFLPSFSSLPSFLPSLPPPPAPPTPPPASLGADRLRGSASGGRGDRWAMLPPACFIRVPRDATSGRCAASPCRCGSLPTPYTAGTWRSASWAICRLIVR